MMKKISNSDIIYTNQVPPRFPAGSYVAYDLEAWTTKEDAKRLHRPVGEFACFAVTADGYNVYVISEQENLQETVNNMRDCVWIAQNASYDLRQIHLLVCAASLHLLLWSKLLNHKLHTNQRGILGVLD